MSEFVEVVPNEMFDLLDDVVNSLAILRFSQREDKDLVGVQLTTELIERVKVKRAEAYHQAHTITSHSI